MNQRSWPPSPYLSVHRPARVYVNCANGRLYALRGGTAGEPLWRVIFTSSWIRDMLVRKTDLEGGNRPRGFSFAKVLMRLPHVPTLAKVGNFSVHESSDDVEVDARGREGRDRSSIYIARINVLLFRGKNLVHIIRALDPISSTPARTRINTTLLLKVP